MPCLLFGWLECLSSYATLQYVEHWLFSFLGATSRPVRFADSALSPAPLPLQCSHTPGSIMKPFSRTVSSAFSCPNRRQSDTVGRGSAGWFPSPFYVLGQFRRCKTYVCCMYLPCSDPLFVIGRLRSIRSFWRESRSESVAYFLPSFISITSTADVAPS